jgi:flagellin
MPIVPLTHLPRALDASARAGAAHAERLSTGLRIVRAADDAAGLAVAERLRSRHGALAVALRDVTDGISLIQTADGALGELHGMLQRVRELAVRTQSGAPSAIDRAAAQAEADELRAEATRLVERTAFNGRSLLTGGTIALQVGARAGDQLVTALPDLAPVLATDPFLLEDVAATTTTTSTSTTTTTDADISGGGNAYGRRTTTTTTSTTTTATEGGTALERIDAAIDAVSRHRGALGGLQNRLEHVLGASATERENLLAAESRIRDADVGAEVAALTRTRILQSTQTALTAQALEAERTRVLALVAA